MKEYDIVVIGGGPIGASTLYHLASSGVKNIALITDDSESDTSATYKSAGGSIRWFWDEDIKREMTTETATFVNKLIDQGVDLSEHKDNYLFVWRGKYTPSLNISGAKLVSYFKDQSVKNGAEVFEGHRLESLEKKEQKYIIRTSSSEFKAKKVLLALGVANEKFMPGLELEHEKRQIFVTDIPVTDENINLPHTIVPVGDDAYGYIFVKKYPEGYKIVVAQEDIVEDNDETKAVDYYKEMLSGDFGRIMPFLKDAKVEKISWGIDVGNKTLKLFTQDNILFSANCGSAVRACVFLGRDIAESLLK